MGLVFQNVVIVYPPKPSPTGQFVMRICIVNFNIKPTYVNTICHRATRFGTVRRVGDRLVFDTVVRQIKPAQLAFGRTLI